jgi:DNA-binding CsgD family transcriptional regulator
MAGDEPDLEQVLRTGERHDVFAALLAMMSRSLRPTVMVIEDVHWADNSTLDMVKYLGRRISDTHGLLVMTLRDSEVSADHPLNVALADLPNAVVSRIQLEPLSVSAIEEMADGDTDVGWIRELSGGNPFFVSEMLAGDPDSIPASIREAIRARLIRLSDGASDLAELVSVVPGRVELAVLDSIFENYGPLATESEIAGLLEVRGASIGYRHELARRAVEEDLPEIRRRALNKQVLAALEDEGLDVTRRAHHARQAADADAIVRLLPMAARRAVEMESHREALQQLRALQPYLEHLDREQLADYYDLLTQEEYNAATELAGSVAKKAVEMRRELGEAASLGNTLLMASRINWVDGKRAEAVDLAAEAASVLQPVGGEALAFAYSTLSQLAMLASDEEQTTEYVEKALESAPAGPSRARAHALNNLGSVRLNAEYPDGLKELEESYRMNAELGLSGDQVRAAVNISWSALMWRDLPTAKTWIDRGLAIAYEREIPTFEAYLIAEQALLAVEVGDWHEAEMIARKVIEGNLRLEVSRIVATILLGKLQTRLGSPEAQNTLQRGWEMANRTNELQRIGPAAAAMAEHYWLFDGPEPGLRADLVDVMERCMESSLPWLAGDIGIWLYLAGSIEELPPGLPHPYTSLANGQWEEAAGFWSDRGIPYERAVALSVGDTDARIESLQILDGLGDCALAAKLRSEMQRSGMAVPRRPHSETRKNPLGLTARQADVLELIAQGMTNNQIANQLFVSPRTVDHHVSAILAKLGAPTRDAAVDVARRAGISL